MLSSSDNEDCSVFVAPDGNIHEVMCCDYGFRSGFGRLYQGGDGEIPKSAFALVRDCTSCSLQELTHLQLVLGCIVSSAIT